MTNRRFTALFLLLATGCYQSVPLAGSVPRERSEVELRLTDSGSATLGELVGREPVSIRGHYEGTSGDTVNLSVLSVTKRNGIEDFWKQERLGIPRSAVATISERKLSVQRTGLVAAFGVAAAVLVKVGFSGRTNTSGTRRPPPAGQ